MAEFNINVHVTTTGKQVILAVEPEFTVNSILGVLSETLQLKDKFVLANKDNQILSGDVTVAQAGLAEGATLQLLPDPTGG